MSLFPLSCIGNGMNAPQVRLLLWALLTYTAAATPVNIRILSQNVQFIHFVNTVGNRGYGISAALLNKRPQYDVLVFQEVFVDQGREDLLQWLSPQYPHVLQQQKQPDDEKKNVSFQFYDSGLLVLSKFPIRQSWYTKYSQSTGLDYLSDKGAVVALLDVPGAGNTSAPLLVAGTHLQADGSRDIMKGQVDEMGQLLSQVVDEVTTDTIPPPLTVACGDFNIRHTRPALYKYLLAGLSNDTVDTFVPFAPAGEEQGTTPGSQHRIDYIFHLRGFGRDDDSRIMLANTTATLVDAGIDRFAPTTNVEGHAALSDHYGVWASFDMPGLEAGPPGPLPLTIPPLPTPSPTVPPMGSIRSNSGRVVLLGPFFWTCATLTAVVVWIN